jgi:hypothetical protein
MLPTSTSVMKVAGAVEEVAQSGPFEAVRAPLYLRRRAAPGFAFKIRSVAFGEFPVEPGIVGDDDHGMGHKRSDGRLIDPVTRDHFIGDAGKGDDFERDRAGRLVERREDVPETCYSAVWQVVRLGHSKLDDLVLLVVEAGRLDVGYDACSAVRSAGRCDRARHETRKTR